MYSVEQYFARGVLMKPNYHYKYFVWNTVLAMVWIVLSQQQVMIPYHLPIGGMILAHGLVALYCLYKDCDQL